MKQTMTKKLLHTNIVDIDVYWKGILFGLAYDDQILHIILPFIMVDIKLYMFLPRKQKQFKNKF